MIGKVPLSLSRLDRRTFHHTDLVFIRILYPVLILVLGHNYRPAIPAEIPSATCYPHPLVFS